MHAATSPLPPAEPPADVYFDARTRWVERAIGEPRPLDEDLALAYLAAAGIGPERTLGIARHTTIDPYDTGESQHYLTAQVHGVHVFLPGRPAPPSAPLAAGPPAGVRIELLNWDAIAAVVHPVRQHRPYLPSRFPYLPLTPQELLRAYLGIVGVAPHDSYGVQVTYDKPLDLLGRSSTSSHVRKTTGGDELPCADGKPRVRMHGGAHVVARLPRQPGLRRGPAALGRLRGRGPPGRPLARHRPAPAAARRQVGMGKAERTVNRVTDVVVVLRSRRLERSRAAPAALLLAARGRMTTFALAPRRVARRVVLGAAARAARAARPRRAGHRPARPRTSTPGSTPTPTSSPPSSRRSRTT